MLVDRRERGERGKGNVFVVGDKSQLDLGGVGQALLGVDAEEDKHRLLFFEPGDLGDGEGRPDVDDGDLGLAGSPSDTEAQTGAGDDSDEATHQSTSRDRDDRRCRRAWCGRYRRRRCRLHQDTNARKEALPLA